MAIVCQVTGPPATGKTFAVRRLVERYPGQVVYINADKKSLPWIGWRREFSSEKKNYFVTSDMRNIKKTLHWVSVTQPDVAVVIVDTINTIMDDKEMAERKKAGYDKWWDLASIIYEDAFNYSHTLREDLIVIFMAHSDAYQEGDVVKYRTKTSGQKLTKLNLHGKLTYNLYTKVTRDNNENEYSFITQTDGTTEARSTHGVLPLEMPNDLGEVVHRIRVLDLEVETDPSLESTQPSEDNA